MNAYLDKTDNFIASLGVEAYRVGGSVRDELLGRAPKDADYVVRGQDLRSLGDILTEDGRAKVLPLVLRDGQQGGYRVIYKGMPIEIMLPRTEVSTGPRHEDFRLILDPDLPLIVDAQRRDFTFNALYREVNYGDKPFTATGAALDPLGCGIFDLQHRVINVTHPDSFRDDPLRILRALRFISTLGYELGPDTRALMHVHADAATGLTAGGHASGTVKDELEKLLMGADPATALRVARDTGVLGVVLPELARMIDFEQESRYHDMTTDEHTFTTLEVAAKVNAPLRVRMALLFHDAGKPDTAWIGPDGRKHYYRQFKELTRASIMHAPGTARVNVDHEVQGERIWRKAAARLGVEKCLREDVAVLIRNHMVPAMKADPVRARRERVRLGDSIYRDLLLMRVCDLSGKGEPNRKFLDNVCRMEVLRSRAATDGVPMRLKDLTINGRDVKALVKDGREVGRILNAVLDEVVVDPSELKLTRDWQLEAARRHA